MPKNLPRLCHYKPRNLACVWIIAAVSTWSLTSHAGIAAWSLALQHESIATTLGWPRRAINTAAATAS